MNNFERITRWLQAEKPSYQEGYELLKELSGKTFFIDLLATEDPWNAKKLHAELLAISRELVPTKPPEIHIRRQMAQEVLRDELKRPSDRREVPEPIRQAVEKRKALYKEGASLHARLPLYDTDEKRLEAALRICAIFDEIHPLWQLTNYYDLHGSLPPVIQTASSDIPYLDPVTLNAEWLTHYKYVRAYKDKPKQRQKCVARIIRMNEIETDLRNRDAFQYSRLNCPLIVIVGE